MPKYRFQWDNVPPTVLIPLAHEIGAPGSDAPNELRARFGARPKDDFVRACWPTIREQWLANDPIARHRVVEALAEAGVGSQFSGDDDMEFLRSIRNAKTMRSIVLAAFHELGEPQSDIERADLGRVRSRAWEPYSMTLAETLAALDEDQYLILFPEDRPAWYVQFAVQGVHGLRGELVSNSYLAPEHQLSDRAVAAAIDLGWNEPTGTPGESTPGADPDGSPNFFEDWASPVQFIEVARLAVETLVEVLDVAHPGSLRYDAFTSEGVPIVLPALGQRGHDVPDDQGDVSSSRPPDAGEVAGRVLEMLRHASGKPELTPDSDGDIPLPYGSSMVFVRVFGDPPIIRVYAPALGRVMPDPDLPTVINNLNLNSTFVKWLFVDNTIVAAMDLFGWPLQETHVLNACGVVGNSADDLDDQLQERFGGKTFFGEHLPPKYQPNVSGYL
jgi:hypothetical protein